MVHTSQNGVRNVQEYGVEGEEENWNIGATQIWKGTQLYDDEDFVDPWREVQRGSKILSLGRVEIEENVVEFLKVIDENGDMYGIS